MARRKQQYLEDGYSSDSASSSSSAGQVDVCYRKRKRTKEDEIYGIFGSGDEDENERQGGIGRTVQTKDRKGRRVDYLKGQTFVPANGSSDTGEVEVERESSNDETDDDDDDDDGDENDDFAEAEQIAREPATDLEEMETRNPFALGPTLEQASMEEQHKDPSGFRPASFVSSRGGIGAGHNSDQSSHRIRNESSQYPTFTRGGIGTSKTISEQVAQHASVHHSELREAGVPSAFISAPPSDAFVPRRSKEQSNQRPLSFVTPTTSIKFGGGLGGKFDPSKYLAQMGWTGGGLGKQGEGIVNPIEVKQRPERAGIAFGGLREKTKQAKEEAMRRGEEVSTDEEERDQRKKTASRTAKNFKQAKGEQAWTKTERKPRKPKVEHRTYEELLEEHGHAAAPGSLGSEKILDAAGNEYDSLSAALARHTVPSSESAHLVETRHNLRLICDQNHRSLQAMAKEGANIQDKRKWLQRDRDESLRRIDTEEKQRSHLQEMLDLVRQMEALGRKSQTDTHIHLSTFDPLIKRTIVEFRDDVVEYGLDEAVVGAVMPILRQKWSTWDPLEKPMLTTDHLAEWKDILRREGQSEVMTPYESLLWNLWMPPVRSALNNHWDPFQPAAAIALYNAWSPLLSPFLVDNLTQQLILPKLARCTADWDAKLSLHQVLFPWMALLGRQMEEIVGEAKRRLRTSLKSWKTSRGVPADLVVWKEAKVFTPNEWNAMLLDHVVPKISLYLDSHLAIDPWHQDMHPLEMLLSWKHLFAPKILAKVFHAKFLPKWIHTLHAWLANSNANLEEVAAWYGHWKEWFTKQDVMQVTSLQEGFQLALQLMDRAVEMGDDRIHLPAPNLKLSTSAATTSRNTPIVPGSMQTTEQSAASSFRIIVEDAMMEANLIMQSLNRKDVRSGKPLYRVSSHLDGKGGVTLYMDEDVVFAEKRDDSTGATVFEPVSISALIQQVSVRG